MVMKILKAFLILCAMTALAQAQPQFSEWNATAQGRGTIRIQGQRDEALSRASINLRRNGELEIRVFSIVPTTFKGYWFGGRDFEVEIEIEEAFGDTRASGLGTASLRRGGGIESIEINGETRGRKYALYFESGQSPIPGGNRSEYVGAFRSAAQTGYGREENRLIRVLRINQDGTAQLSSRFRGIEPTTSRDNIRLYGSLLIDIQKKKKIYHSGTWRVNGRRLEVSLNTLDERDRVDCRLVFEFRGVGGERLDTVFWDRNLYGTSGFQFERIGEDMADDDDRYPGRDEDITMYQRGTGVFTQEGRRNQAIVSISVSAGQGGNIDIGVGLLNGYQRVLSGRQERRDAYTLRIRLTNSRDADAEGTIMIDYGARNSINRVYGEGRLDGARFSIQFTK
jgi:hypothetical protein